MPQQSPFELQVLPSTRQELTQTVPPRGSCGLLMQSPRQQSPFRVHGVDGSRQAPCPRSHRPVFVLHAPEQHGGPPSASHPSPLGRQAAVVGAHPPGPPHRPEQHVASEEQGVPSAAQIGPPHVPPLQPIEQQSLASRQREPSAMQYCAHSRAPVRVFGSQRSLQQSVRVLHGAPGAAHVPGPRQYPCSQRLEQQSLAIRQDSPFARHAKGETPGGKQPASRNRRGSKGPSKTAPPPGALSRGRLPDSTAASNGGSDASTTADGGGGAASLPLSKLMSSPHAARASARARAETHGATRPMVNRPPRRGGGRTGRRSSAHEGAVARRRRNVEIAGAQRPPR